MLVKFDAVCLTEAVLLLMVKLHRSSSECLQTASISFDTKEMTILCVSMWLPHNIREQKYYMFLFS